MAAGKRIRYFITNHQDQPAELYLPGGVIVVGPRGTAEMSKLDLNAPQLRTLMKMRLLSAREMVEPETVAPSAAELKPPRPAASRKDAEQTEPVG